MHAASVILFWIPRSDKNPARTTNVEFGEWYKKEGVYTNPAKKDATFSA